jgi:hypothetical protein
MRYTTFGRHTGLRVSEYALGTGNFGIQGRPGQHAVLLIDDVVVHLGDELGDQRLELRTGRIDLLLPLEHLLDAGVSGDLLCDVDGLGRNRVAELHDAGPGSCADVHHREVKNQRLAAAGCVWAFASCR